MSETSTAYPSPSDDPEMVKASEKARQTFRFFWREMAWERRRIIPGLELAAVKAAFSDPPEIQAQNPDALEVEQMWLLDVDFDGRQLTGTLINSPVSLKTVHEGDEISIPGKRITDWMYVIDGNVYGGFTVDLMRSRMRGGERRQHDGAWGFDFGEVGVVDLVPPGYIGKEPKKKGFFSRLFGGSKSEPQDYAIVASREHPMSVNMRPSFEEALQNNPEMLHQTDDAHGFTFLHQLALAGSYDGVDVCLNRGADPKKTANNGLTPYQLAKCLGWKKVMKRIEEAGGA